MKKRITIRVDEDVLEWFKAGGKGYQSKMNDALRLHTEKVDILRVVDDFKYKPEGKADLPSVEPAIETVIKKVAVSDNFFKPMPKKGKKSK